MTFYYASAAARQTTRSAMRSAAARSSRRRRISSADAPQAVLAEGEDVRPTAAFKNVSADAAPQSVVALGAKNVVASPAGPAHGLYAPRLSPGKPVGDQPPTERGAL